MSSKFKSKARLSSSDSDSDAEYKPEKKKQKKEKKQEKKAKSSSDGDGDGEHMYAISRNRFVNVREFKGKVLIDIREYYNAAEGDLKPGKKGISLTVEQWRKLVDKIDEVNDSISEMS